MKGLRLAGRSAVRDLVVRQQRRLNVAGQRTQVADLRDHAGAKLALDVERVGQLTRPSGRGLPVVIGDIRVAVGDGGIDLRHWRPKWRAALQRK